MDRPELTRAVSEADFKAWYWLKAELVVFCRTEGLPASGSKRQLEATISAYLASRELPSRARRQTRAAEMPSTFTPETIIGDGWRCTQALRGFFESHLGKGFRFNEPLRNFIRSGSGRTLGEALAHYRRSLVAGPRPIAGQFEYNKHMREYRKANPGSTHAEAVSAWWEKRGRPRA